MSQFFNMKIAVKVGNNLHRRHLHADTRVMFETPWIVSANGNDAILQQYLHMERILFML